MVRLVLMVYKCTERFALLRERLRRLHLPAPILHAPPASALVGIPVSMTYRKRDDQDDARQARLTRCYLQQAPATISRSYEAITKCDTKQGQGLCALRHASAVADSSKKWSSQRAAVDGQNGRFGFVQSYWLTGSP